MGIPCKTAAGHAELVASERRLSQRHRTLLLLVDGRRSVDEVLQLGLQAGVPRAYLDELLALGLIVLAAPMTAAVQLDQDPFAATAAASAFASTPEVASVHEHDDDAMLDTVGLGPAISNTQLAQLDDTDLAFAQARSVLLQALLMRSPVSGAVTMLRVRRARNRVQLRALLPEAHARLARPLHLAQARQVISRVEALLAS
ncbi:hypothetical protein Lcho_3840 [Leptothrix cholodnii SP-6]|uniref:Uncharacterized protein n=1 Tax=Leptothrix cholodnii (strain ATCC 51168 / LMG 8142 / SP-6) TaxID=395495 RepID=B1Y6R6_LEPCP|nr:hypothetical protein [Leptothrix cholodnii]ACB36094.1 hypothetical protein Lcho_3840 [Leptothrix cholodnii SP-6]